MDFKRPQRPTGGQPLRPSGVQGQRPAASPFAARPAQPQRPVSPHPNTAPQRPQMARPSVAATQLQHAPVPRPATMRPQQPVAQHPSTVQRPVATPQQTAAQGTPKKAAKRRLSLKKILLITGGALVLVAAITVAIIHFTSGPSVPANKVGSTTKELGFDAILPEGKSAKDLGGWKRVSPASSDPVYAYSDTIDGVGITVSEQALPASFLANVDTKVAVLATDYNATDKLSAGATTFYIGKSAQGPQSVIFTKSGLLVLIKSQKVIQDALWMQYIGSLS